LLKILRILVRENLITKLTNKKPLLVLFPGV